MFIDLFVAYGAGKPGAESRQYSLSADSVTAYGVFKRFGFNSVDDLAASEDRKIGESEKRLVFTHRPGNKPYGALYLSARAFDSVGRRIEAIEELNHCAETLPPHKC